MPTKPRPNRKRNQKRALDAFSIATEEEPERARVRQHRLGESAGDDLPRKRRRVENDGESDQESSELRGQHRKGSAKGRSEEPFSDEGSDSEGNTWRMGGIQEDDDSDIDSDDAFGESDEERFEGFTFRGSSSNLQKPKRRKIVERESSGDLNLDDDIQGTGDEDEEDSLGEDAVDLATMLDNYEGSDEDVSDSGNEGSSDDESRDNEHDVDGLSKLDAFVSALPLENSGEDVTSRRQRPDPNARPGESINRPKLSMDAFLAADENIKSIIPSFKQAKKYTSGKATEVPLPERQRAKLERTAADKKAKETLERWVDTVKHNRRAEHVSFPLVDKNNAEPLGAKKLLSTSKQKPATELESAIADIMQKSGLDDSAKDEEQQLQEFEELQMNQMPLEEVQARRAALRQTRDLMFREEIKAKRIKKIKSKAYRRVHRKERERQAMRDADVFGDGEIDDEERERLHRRRAEERMGAKHRESKWAKAIKKTGQAAWNDDAREGITDMARRNEELRRRQEGRDGSDSDRLTASEDDEDEDFSDDEAAINGYKKSLDELDSMSNGKRSALSSMKFMKEAEAAKRAQNDEDMERLRLELNGDDPFETITDDQKVAGRRRYGPQDQQAKMSNYQSTQTQKSEFESNDNISSDEDAEIILQSPDDGVEHGPKHHKVPRTKSLRQKDETLSNSHSSTKAKESAKVEKVEQNPFLNNKRPKRRNEEPKAVVNLGLEMLPDEVHGTPDADGFTTVTYEKKSSGNSLEASDDEEQNPPTLSRQQQLIQQAFAGDDAFEDFSKEKKELAAEDDDKVIDNSMPGWGSWAGTGLTKRDQRVATSLKKKLQTVKQGIKPEDRKDAKMQNVIISEKRVKKNGQYLAGQLPFPYTTRAEYERSMRMPVGGEWNTKTVVQKNTTPRVIVKPGRVITPIEAPML